MTQDKQPEALRLAVKCAEMTSMFDTPSHERGVLNGAAQELRKQHAELERLRAEVEVLRKQHGPLRKSVRMAVFDDLYPHGALPQTFNTFNIIADAIEAAHGITALQSTKEQP